MRSELPGGWKALTWGDVATLAYGKSLKGRESEGEIPIFGTNGQIGTGGEALCPNAGIIIGRKGAYRGIHFSDRPFWVIDTAFYLVPDETQIELRWAYYELLTHDIDAMDSGSAIPSTSRSDFYALPCRVPPIEEQQRVAWVLDALTEKAAANDRLRDTIIELGGVLFRQLMATPSDDWVEAKIRDLADINALSHSARSHPDVIDYIDISSVSPHRIDEIRRVAYDDAPSRARRIVRGGDTLVSTVRPERRSMAFVHTASERLTASTGFAVVSPTKGSPTFVYRLVTSDACIDMLSSTATGSAYPAVNPNVLADWSVVVPPDFGAAFDQMMRPAEGLSAAANAEARGVLELRDALLPKLVSGEIRVPDTKDVQEALAASAEHLGEDTPVHATAATPTAA
jgi:type I restriction enzyme S subunit